MDSGIENELLKNGGILDEFIDDYQNAFLQYLVTKKNGWKEESLCPKVFKSQY